MKQLIFHGYSDDTFGEYGVFRDDYDNCASGSPIRFVVEAGGNRLLVSGQYSPTNSGCWSIAVEPLNEDNMPNWKMYFDKSDCSYSPALCIEVPDDVSLHCMERVAWIGRTSDDD